MTDLSDLRRRAAQQAGYGSYWPGKVVALCDRQRDAAARLRHLAERMTPAAPIHGDVLAVAESLDPQPSTPSEER